MQRPVSVVIALWIALVGSVATADTHLHKPTKLTFWLPDDWEVEATNDSRLKVTDPDHQLLMIVSAGAFDRLEKDVDALDDLVEKLGVTIIQSNEPKETELNGMPLLILSGTGKVKKERVDYGVAMVLSPSKKTLILFTMAPHRVLAKYDATMDRIVMSIKPPPKPAKPAPRKK